MGEKEMRRMMLADPELLKRVRDMETATGNKLRLSEAPDGSLIFDYSTPGNDDVAMISAGPSRRERRAKRRNRTRRPT